MNSKLSAYRGCLLGLAVGDAMGYSVDTKTWPQIQEDYGPNGLLGYDLCNGYADVTSHTQLAAFTCNALLLGMTRGQVLGKMAPFVKYVEVGHKEWAMGQRSYDQPRRNYCWVFRIPELRRRHCTDTRIIDNINRGLIGTPEEPRNKFDGCAGIATAVAVGLFDDPKRMDQSEIDRLGAEAIAITHGSPIAFLPGAVIAHLISRLLRDRVTPLTELIEESLTALEEQFSHEYVQVKEICTLARRAIFLGSGGNLNHVEALESLKCDTGAEVLAGAIYVSLACCNDFDGAMIAAVNHSGRSAAVASIAGAILGARLGAEALPEFYLECLEAAPMLVDLADDLVQGCPMVRGNKLFDGDWDRKYLHGEY
ncbi:MAG: ADP-ribosylglycohydrolase family protein [Oscillospiraceae bacterium]|nr:ADP-ribosylglycohydrolase family protein [Oscillospiraceae bacterium]